MAQTRVPAKPAPAKPAPKVVKRTDTPRPPAPKPQPRPEPAATPQEESSGTNPAAVLESLIPPQQAPSFARGNTAFNLGLGVGQGYGYGFDGYGGALESSPALSLSGERGLLEIGTGVLSLGGLLGYNNYHYDWSAGGRAYRAKWSNFYVAARAAYHYNFTNNPKLDTYAGVSLSARLENYSNNSGDQSLGSEYGKTYLDTGIFLGGRYFLTENLGGFAELGYDMSYLKIGVTGKF